MSEGISVGSVSVDVVPDTGKFAARLRAQLLPDATAVGNDLGRTIGERIAAKVRDALPAGLSAGARAAAAQGGRAGDEYGGSFARTARTRIEAALKSLPQPNVGVDATALDAELADIRARMAALGDIRIGVDLDAAAALAETSALKARLDELGARSPDIRVKVDAARAAAELAAIQEEVDHLDHKNVDIETGSAVSGLSTLAVAGIALGPAIVPAAAAAAAAVAGIGAGAFAAVAGIGVLAIGLAGITAAVKELTAGHNAAGVAAARSASQQVSSAAAVANAEQQLGDAHRAVVDAERSAASSVQAALTRQQDAETTLARAQRDARQAQLDLSAARRQAKADLEDLTLQVQDGALAQRQANLDVENARLNLNKVLADPTADALQRQQAQLTYDQAVQQVSDLAVRQQRLQAQQTAAAKAGVTGAAGVIAAQQKVADSQTTLTKAKRDEATAAAAVTEARRAGAEAILAANERVISAERQLQVAQASATAATAAGFTKTKSALDALTPSGQRFARFLAGLEPILGRIRAAAQNGLLPGLQAGLTALLPAVPAITGVIGGLSRVLGTLFAQAGQAFTAPFWQQFFTFLGQTVGPNLITAATIVGHLATGFAGLVQAFAPVATSVGTGLAGLTGQFAAFGQAAGGNSSVQAFIAYLQSVGPKVVTTIGDVVRALARIAVALAPIGAAGLAAIRALAAVIQKLPVKVLTALAAAIIGVAVAVKAWSLASKIFTAVQNVQTAGTLENAVATKVAAAATKAWAIAQAILNAVMDANPIVLVVLAVAALAAGFVIAYKESATFRRIVHAALSAVETAARGVYDWLKKNWPYLLGILGGPFALAAVVIAKHWDAIKAGATAVKKWITDKFDAVIGFFQKMPGRITNAAKGMWDGISTAFKATINLIISWWDGFVSHLKIPGIHLNTHIPGVPKVDWGGLDIGKNLQIPFLADGGMATAATLGVFGEAGREAILPLDNPSAIAAIRDSLAPRGGHGPLVGELKIVNPAPEPASTSLPKALRETAWRMGLTG